MEYSPIDPHSQVAIPPLKLTISQPLDVYSMPLLKTQIADQVFNVLLFEIARLKFTRLYLFLTLSGIVTVNETLVEPSEDGSRVLFSPKN